MWVLLQEVTCVFICQSGSVLTKSYQFEILLRIKRKAEFKHIFTNKILSKMFSTFLGCLEATTECVLKKCTLFAGQRLCRSLFYTNVAGLTQAAFLKEGCGVVVFRLGFAKFGGVERLFYSTTLSASVCSFYNLKIFICDIWQIYKLKKNILLNLCITCI